MNEDGMIYVYELYFPLLLFTSITVLILQYNFKNIVAFFFI